MIIKINPVNGKEIDPMFDGHPEKRLSEMTPVEKLQYLWMQMEFKWRIRNVVNLGKTEMNKQK